MIRVLLDVDGPLADFIGGILPIIENVTGRAYTHDNIDQFDFCESLKLTPTERSCIMRAISDSQGFCTDLKPHPAAIEGVRQLREIADVHFVTSPWISSPSWVYERTAWLKRHFWVNHDHVHHSSAKHLFYGDVFVDDKAESVTAWREAWPGKLAVLWRMPSNRNDTGPYLVTSSWDTLYQWVSNLTKLDKGQFELEL